MKQDDKLVEKDLDDRQKDTLWTLAIESKYVEKLIKQGLIFLAQEIKLESPTSPCQVEFFKKNSPVNNYTAKCLYFVLQGLDNIKETLKLTQLYNIVSGYVPLVEEEKDYGNLLQIYLSSIKYHIVASNIKIIYCNMLNQGLGLHMAKDLINIVYQYVPIHSLNREEEVQELIGSFSQLQM